jgi:predicted kinase
VAGRRVTPIVVVLAGVPGAGKTTLARELIARTAMWYLSRDDIRVAMFQPCAFTDEEKFASFEAMALALEVNLRLGRSCIAEGMPFSRVGELERIEEIAVAEKARVAAFLLDVPLEVAAARVGHDARDGQGRVDAHDRVPALVTDVATRMRTFPASTRRLDATRPVADLADEVLRTIGT